MGRQNINGLKKNSSHEALKSRYGYIKTLKIISNTGKHKFA